jgi:lysophospholipase L1-like esterase
MLIALSAVAAIVLGGLVALLAAPIAGLSLAVLLLAGGAVAQRADGGPRRAIGLTLLVALLVGGSYGAVVAIDVLGAVTETAGEPEAPDAGALASAEAKIAGLDGDEFRLELTEGELQAVIQDRIASSPDVPVQRVDLELRGATRDMGFTAQFKRGSVTADGTAELAAVDGGIDVTLGALRFGGIRVPSVATGAIRSLLASVTDLNAALAAQGASVRSIEITDELLVVTGTRAGGALTGDELLDAIRSQAAVGVEGVVAPAEVLGPGRVDGLEAPGEPVVLALGDSLAANVGVVRAADGYVSRFHRAVSDRDGIGYGLANLGVPGETSGSLLVGGQLAAAEQVLATRTPAYVTIDIGANDLLGHIESPDCGADLRSAACQQRIDQTLVSYRANLDAVFDRLLPAAGDARVVLLQFYNPFSLGLRPGEPPADEEAASNEMVDRMNAVAAEVAAARGVLVADGATPMRDTTAVTTGMLAADPDVHPNALGHDVLATALFRAVGG